MTKKSEDQAVPATPVPAKRPRNGRFILDAQKQAEICGILAMGCTRKRAADFVGCAPSTISNTAKREPAFGIAMRKAEAQQEVSLLAHIKKASNERNGWRAAAWLLQKSYPDRYARKADTMTREQVSGILAQFADILTRGIRSARDRTKVSRDLRLLTSLLTSEAEGEQVR